MNNLLKGSQVINFLVIYIIYVCYIVLHVAATNVYFFERDLISRKLRFSHNDTQNICNNNKDTACLNPSIFSYSTSPLQIYQVLEYQDYLNNWEFILEKTNHSNFPVIDPRNQTWYLVYNGEPEPLVPTSDKLETMQLSILYYTDVFFYVPDAHQYTNIAATLAMVVTVSAVIATATAMILRCIYKYNGHDNSYDSFSCSFSNWYLPWLLWMVCATVFSGAILGRLVVIKSKIDGWYITLISIMANWGSTSFIIWTLIYKASDILLIYRIKMKSMNWNLFFLLLGLVLSLAPCIIFFSLDGIVFGADDASLLTGYSYINTVTNSFDGIQFM
jgi:hypothetical protein